MNKIAQSLIKINALKFVPDNPIIFKSGIKSPVYVDCRELPFHPAEWKQIITEFEELIKGKNITFDVIAGVASGGIPHSAALSFTLKRPSVFVREKLKDHGTQSRIEGGRVAGKTVLLIEDLITLGLSSLSAVESLRREGAKVNNCISVVNYDFPEAKETFKKNNVNLYSLTTFPEILEAAKNANMFSDKEISLIKKWFSHPHVWEQHESNREI